jgi:thioredoxin-dependent peroxiredoxin
MKVAAIVAVLLIAGAAALPLMLRAADSTLTPGSSAPEFTLPSQDGSNISLKDYRGKWVVLYFYPKDMTSGCTIEARNFQKDQPAFASKNAVVLGVSVDSVNSHKEFCTKEGLNFKLLADPDGKVVKAYDSLNDLKVTKYAQRHTFIIDPSGKIAKVYMDVNPSNHSQEVLTELAQLQTKQ